MFQRDKGTTKGFTLFEMMIVMAIIGIIAFLVFARFREGQGTYALAQSAQRLVADTRKAQGMAIAGAETPGYSSIGGYGIYIKTADSYTLFLNNNTSLVYSGSSVALETIKLSQGVSTDKIGSSVFFVPPSPRTYINGNPGDEIIEFNLTKGSKSQKVLVTKYGMIEVE